MYIGPELKVIMRDFGISVKELSEMTGIARSQISQWRNDRQPIMWPGFMKLCKCFGMDKTAFFAAGRGERNNG